MTAPAYPSPRLARVLLNGPGSVGPGDGFTYAQRGGDPAAPNYLRSIGQRFGDDFIQLAECGLPGATTLQRFQAGVSFLSSRGGGRLVIPRGTTDLGQDLLTVTPDNIIISGHHAEGSIIHSSAQSGDIVSIGDGVANPHRTYVECLSIHGDGNRQGAGLRFRNGYDCGGRHLMFAGMDRSIQGDGGSNQCYLTLDDIITFDGTQALTLGDTGGKVIQAYLTRLKLTSCSDAAYLLVNVSGLFAHNCESLFAGRGLATFPSKGQAIDACYLGNIFLDSSVNESAFVATNGDSTGSGKIWDLNFGQGARLSTGGVTTGATGLRIVGYAPRDISGVSADAARIMNHGGHGVSLVNAEDTAFNDCNVWANGQKNPGNFSGIFNDGSANGTKVNSGRIGPCQRLPAVTHQYAILWGAGSDRNYVGGGVDMSGFTVAAMNSNPPGANSVVGEYIAKKAWP